MNLYKLLVEHYGPKDSISSIMGYLIAENEDQVYDFILNCPYDQFDESVGWIGDPDEFYWNDVTEEEDLSHRDWVITNKGELGEEMFLEDLYYGQSLFGWELVQENISDSEINYLVHYNIAIKVK